jgi:rRNA maturation RNase YbeY
MEISFSFLQPIALANRKALRSFIAKMMTIEDRQAEMLGFIFCSDEYLLKINKDFLSHDYYTDIITFDLSEPGSSLISGEIYISVDTVRDNAHRFKTSIVRELHRVMFHGILHLCGYSDKTKAQQSIMREMEDRYLDLYFG